MNTFITHSDILSYAADTPSSPFSPVLMLTSAKKHCTQSAGEAHYSALGFEGICHESRVQSVGQGIYSTGEHDHIHQFLHFSSKLQHNQNKFSFLNIFVDVMALSPPQVLQQIVVSLNMVGKLLSLFFFFPEDP